MHRCQWGQDREKANFSPPSSSELLAQLTLFHEVIPNQYCQCFHFWTKVLDQKLFSFLIFFKQTHLLISITTVHGYSSSTQLFLPICVP